MPYSIYHIASTFVLYTGLSSEMNGAQQQQLIKEHALGTVSKGGGSLEIILSLTLLLYFSSPVSPLLLQLLAD